jgi:ribosome-binding factor A
MAKRGFSRSDRIADQIQRELAEMLQKGLLKDPRVSWVTITHVDVTRDYSHAKIFYTVMVDEKRAITQEALEEAAGFLRNELGKRMRLFTIPQLHFVYDESIERGMHMSQLIDRVAAEDAKREGAADAPAGEGEAE